MKTILLHAPSYTDACAFYRSIGPFAAMRHHEVHYTIMPSDITWGLVADYDCCFMQRPYAAEHLATARIVKNVMPLWLDYDDSMFEVPASNQAYSVLGNQAVLDRIRQLIEMADLVTVSTRELARQLQARFPGQTFHVIPNAHNDYWLPAEPPEGPAQPTVFWRGSHTHQRDLLEFAPQIIEAQHANPKWKFIFMGMAPWMLEHQMQLEYRSGLDIFDYHRTLRELRPSVMIVPLEDTPFNRAKSNIAWIEASAVGAVTVAPAWEEWDNPGTFAYASPDGFRAMLEMAMACSGATSPPESIPLLSQTNQARLQLLQGLSQ